MSELKPCPFCKEAESIIVAESEMYEVLRARLLPYYKVECFCGATGQGSFSREYAVDYWNIRTPDTSAKMNVEALTHYQMETQAREAFEKDCADSLVDLTPASKISANHGMPYADGETNARWWGFRDGYECGFNAALSTPRSDAVEFVREVYSLRQEWANLPAKLSSDFHIRTGNRINAMLRDWDVKAEQWLKKVGDV
jgi:hypothetical protein